MNINYKIKYKNNLFDIDFFQIIKLPFSLQSKHNFFATSFERSFLCFTIIHFSRPSDFKDLMDWDPIKPLFVWHKIIKTSL